jgi:hypothetical protein
MTAFPDAGSLYYTYHVIVTCEPIRSPPVVRPDPRYERIRFGAQWNAENAVRHLNLNRSGGLRAGY